MIRCKEIIETENSNPTLYSSTSTVESSSVAEVTNQYLGGSILSLSKQGKILSTETLIEDSEFTGYPAISTPDLNYLLSDIRSLDLYELPLNVEGPRTSYLISLTTDPALIASNNALLVQKDGVCIWQPVVCNYTSKDYPRFDITEIYRILKIVHKNEDIAYNQILMDIVKAFIRVRAFERVTPGQDILKGSELWLLIMKQLFPRFVSGIDPTNPVINQANFLKETRNLPTPTIRLYPKKEASPVLLALEANNPYNRGEITIPFPDSVINDPPIAEGTPEPRSNGVSETPAFTPCITIETDLISGLNVYYLLYPSEALVNNGVKTLIVPNNVTTGWTLYSEGTALGFNTTGHTYFDSYGNFVGQILAVCTTQKLNAGTLDLQSNTCSKVISKPNALSLTGDELVVTGGTLTINGSPLTIFSLE